MYNSGNGVFYNGVQSVSPAGSGNASNGLSVDPGTGDYVLGNDQGDAAMPAQLLNNREIQTVGNNVVFRDNFAAGIDLQTILTAGMFTLRGQPGGDLVEFKMQVGVNNSFVIDVSDSGTVAINGGFLGAFGVMRIRQSDAAVQIGAQSFNGATCQVSGTITGRNFLLSQSSGTLNINRDQHSGMLVTNQNGTGLLTIALPSMFATTLAGFFINISVVNSNGIRVTAPLGATINVSGAITASGGSVQSTIVGSSMILSCVDPSRWQALSVTGSWTI